MRNWNSPWRFFLLLLVTAMLAPATLAQGNGKGGKGGGGDDGGGETVPFPPVGYEVCFIDTPNGFTFEQELDLNNTGQLVGWLNSDGFRYASLVELTVDANGSLQSQASLLEDLVDTSLLPDGFQIETANGISDLGVIVGNAYNAAGERLAYAVDLRLNPPVLDLLPSLGTATHVHRINRSGDIAGSYEVGPDELSLWMLNLEAYYSDDALPRPLDVFDNPVPLDLSDLTPTLLGNELVLASITSYDLSERSESGVGFVIGAQASTFVPFRYAFGDQVGSPSLEIFSNLTVSQRGDEIGGITAEGLWAANGSMDTGKGKGEAGHFRYLTAFELLPPTDSPGYMQDLNESGAVLFESGVVLNDWLDGYGERYVNVADLVDAGDLLNWNYFNEKFFAKLDDSGIIIGGSARREKRFVSELGPKFFLVPRTTTQ